MDDVGSQEQRFPVGRLSIAHRYNPTDLSGAEVIHHGNARRGRPAGGPEAGKRTQPRAAHSCIV